jgi:putative transposase
MRFRFVAENRGTFKVGRMCDIVEVSRSGFYARLRRPESQRTAENQQLVTKIRLIHGQSRKSYGAPRIHRELKEQGVPCSKNRVARLMRREEIKAKTPRKFKATTDSKHNLPVAPNLLDQRFDIIEPNKVWLADITYVATEEGWLYLAGIMDLGSRRIIGWSMDKQMSRTLTIEALRMALGTRADVQGVMHHSDRGSQYASEDYQKLLRSEGMICSMSRKGNCYDNAVMESFFGTIKTECLYDFRFRSREEARTIIFDYIEIFYNRQRRHSALDYISPCNYEQMKMAA